jgi:predicted O-methyltransferase YrrM
MPIAAPDQAAPFEPLFAAAAPRFRALLDRLGEHAAAFAAIGREPPPQPRWDQDWFPRLDAAALYTLVRARRPRRIVEIGSGHSTRFMARAVADGGLDARITSIDPEPRADIAALPIRPVRERLEVADPALLASLGPGDVLSIDSSHKLKPGNDVALLFERVIPRLSAGTLLHVHDIFLPDPYPAEWGWRRYTEQVVVAALLAGAGFELLWSSHYAATRLADEVARSAVAGLPLVAGARETSLWLEKTAPPVGG